MSSSDQEDWTRIQIVAPLPANVAGVLMSLIGSAWPDSMVDTNSPFAISMKIPPAVTPIPVTQAEVDDLVNQAGDHDGFDFMGFQDGWVAFVEWVVKTGHEADDAAYVLSISRSKGQTPLAMRKQAEAEVERLKALLEQHGVDPEEGT